MADLVLEDATSLELIAELRGPERFQDLPILMVSGKAGREEIVEASRAGVDSFLAKPFDPAQLQQKISEVHRVKRRQLQDKQARRMWENRTERVTDVSGAHVIFGEPISSLEELLSPPNRGVKSFLVSMGGRSRRTTKSSRALRRGTRLRARRPTSFSTSDRKRCCNG